MVLVTIDGKQAATGKTGTNQNETNAILKHYGVVEGYQMDGGGSVTMVVRDDNGFRVVNSPADGSPRSVLTGMFFITRDVLIESKQLSSTENSVMINTKITKSFERNIKNVYVEINGSQYKTANGNVIITGLEQGTSYNYKIFVEDDIGISKTDFGGTVLTQKAEPMFFYCAFAEVENGFVFSPQFDASDTITEVIILVDDIEYNLTGDTMFIPNFSENQEVVLQYTAKLSDFVSIIKVVIFPLYPSTVLLENLKIQSRSFILDLYQ
jgi:hypothetical protein